MNDLFDLTGKVAIVVGGSGGIGHAIAVALARHGADVIVASRTLSKLEPVAGEIKALGRRSLAIAADVTDENSVVSMVERVVREFSRIDILVNAAGLTVRKSAEDISLKEWEQVIDFNARGVFICCQAVGKVMIKQHSGKIINVSSVRGRYGTPHSGVAYAPSKGAIDALTRTLACEWGKHNIYVNAIAPSLVLTDLSRKLLSNPEILKEITARVPLSRVAELDDITGPAIFLASKAANYMTRQILYLDGGTSAGVM